MVSPDPLVLWVKYRESYVRSVQDVILRVKSAEKFGENLRGFADGGGEIVEIGWDSVVKLKPTALEINNSKNPFAQFVTALENAGQEQVSEFLERLAVVSINMCDIPASLLVEFLKKLSLLAGFSFTDICFNKADWKLVAAELSRLNLRALDISGDVLECLVGNVDVELLRLSGSPGLSIKELQRVPNEFVTVKTVVAQELNFVSERDAEDFLALLPARFPRLKTLIWDWNMVDPAVVFDQRTKNITQQLIDIYRRLNLGLLAIIAYTPCGETKHAIGEIARIISEEQLAGVDVQRFSSKGLETDTPNFSTVLLGDDVAAREAVEEIVVRERNSIPNLRHLLSLLSPGSHQSKGQPSVIDFGGFNGAQIKKTFSQKRWDGEVDI